jgi:signal transduction histidine kinase
VHRWSGTSRRLFLAFAALIALFAVASWLALSALADVRASLARTRQQAEGVRVALELASAVRDQYAHQAHTIIIGDQSHLGFYTEAERRVLERTAEVRRHARSEEERSRVDEIERASAELDAVFRRRIVPAVVAGRSAEVKAEHARAQLVVTRIQELSEDLVTAFEEDIATQQARAEAVGRRTFLLALGALASALAVALAVGLYIGRSVALPVARLRAGAERLAAGDLEARIPVERDDEFGALARQFNSMTDALRQHQARLVESEKLAGVGRLAAGVAHEINNPLGVILGYTRILRKKAEGTLAEDLAVVEEETLRCQEIVEGLLDLARAPGWERQPVDLARVCAETVDRLREARLLDGVEVAVRGDGRARGSPTKLRQVVLNLVKNAAEAVGPGGHVSVEITSDGGEATVAVEDDGPGIAPAARERLFEPFQTTKPRGTGLGLAVSRAIARAHGGDIEVGTGGSAGARFVLRLPAAGEVAA